ncbi:MULTISPECIES: hypothetical protein [Streptomyces]|uniref:DUF2929 family protein n=1 Tax=Streptomyces lasiicapitis TaxID=1923961 RepID=A0ABQ2MHE2_9ACTN|nr:MULTISPECIES: hypothetical protein [Streptomyces]GGO52610.1 hypothetical protein GCM10012286_58080 [Streptomyces lasiicapitis]
MKALLWFVLAVAVVVNAFSSLTLDGATEIAVSVTTGVAVIGSITALVLTREKHS